MSTRRTGTKGFKQTSQLLRKSIRNAAEGRGFAVSRLLTHWAEIVGPETAAIARPVRITYGRHGLGANLTLLTTGAQAPMLEMQKERLREKVNAVYGYNAISRVTITQTASTGFAEGQADFTPHPNRAAPPPDLTPDPSTLGKAAHLAAPVGDETLRAALEALGQNVLTKSKC